MSVISKIIKILYHISLYLGLLLLVVIVPLYIIFPYIDQWRLVIAYTSLVIVYIEITDKYFKPDL